jgi:hypothetical protein
MSFEVRYHYNYNGNTKPLGPAVFNSIGSVFSFFNSYLWDYKNPDNNPQFATVYDTESKSMFNFLIFK